MYGRQWGSSSWRFPLCLSSPSSVSVSQREQSTGSSSPPSSSQSTTKGGTSRIASFFSSPTHHVEQFVSHKIADPLFQRFKKGVLAFADERLVTERRRKVARSPVSSANLTQRLEHQRQLLRKTFLPTEVRVSRNREAIYFTWPGGEEKRIQSTEAPVSSPPLSTDAVSFPNRDSSSGSGVHASCVLQAPQHSVLEKNGLPTTTVALAELLRVYTPSTDGTLCTDRVVYGKRKVGIQDLTPIGNYALRISFTDGHNAGIYSYEYLHHLTGPTHKYRLMREYIRALRAQRKSRDPPRRKPSNLLQRGERGTR